MKKLNVRHSTMLLAISMAMAAGTVYADGSAPAAGNTRSDTSQNATSSGGNTQNGASAYVYGQSPSDSKMDDRGSLPPNNTSEATGAPSSGTSQQQSSGASDSGDSSRVLGQGEAEDSSGASGKSGGEQAESTDSSGASNQAGSSESSGASSSGASGSGKKGGTSTVFLMVPVEIASNDNAMKKGCWAKIYDRENFAGESLTLVGPVNLADMGGPFGLNWDDKVKSIETGPKARVTVYDNEGFRDQVAEFKPNQRVGDVSKRVGYFDEFASVRIDC